MWTFGCPHFRYPKIRMKIRLKLIFLIALISVLIALLVSLAVFVGHASEEKVPTQSPGPSASQSAQPRDIAYISRNLNDMNEYEAVMRIKKNFENNANIRFRILDSSGILPLQLDYIESLKGNPGELLIIDPIDWKNVSEKVNQAGLNAIYSGVQVPASQGVSIFFSDAYAAQLTAQQVFSMIYPGSGICIIGSEIDDSLYQSTVGEIQKVSRANGSNNKLYTYFTNNIRMAEFKSLMPELLHSQAVVILDPVNAAAILQYLKLNEFTGDSVVVSQDENMLSKILDGTLNAVVYRDKDEYARLISQTSLSILNEAGTPSQIECYQGLLNIYNITQYMQTKKNAAY